ncbi:MAG TPA: hypothetical protein VGF99_12850, partial [Myxococcota bacterium]
PADEATIAQQETEIRLAVVALDDALNALDRGGDSAEPVTLESPFTGVLSSRLVEAQVSALPDVSRKFDALALAQGFVIANVSRCTQQQNINMTMSNLALQVHPDAYVAYDKRFDGGDEAARAFADGDSDFITWETDYSIDSFPVKYDALIHGAGRRVRGVEGEFPRDIFITRVYLESAQFDDSNSFDLDFQIEVYYTRDDGELVHFYAMWRRMIVAGYSSSEAFFIDTTLNGFIDWEAENDEACTSGLVEG